MLNECMSEGALSWLTAVAPHGNNSGRGLHSQVSDIQEMEFDVRRGSVAPRAAVGGVRAAQVTNSPTADPLTDLLFILWCCGPAGQ